MTEILQMAPEQPPLILLQFWAQKSPPPLRKRAFLHTENVEPPVFDTPLKAPVFTRFFEEPLLLHPRLHPY